MGRTCAVVSCMKTTKDKSVSLHRIMIKIIKLPSSITTNVCCVTYFSLPSDSTLSQQWRDYLKLANEKYAWKETKQMYLCSDHFQPDCKDLCPLGKINLKKNSIPTLTNGTKIYAESSLHHTDTLPLHDLEDLNFTDSHDIGDKDTTISELRQGLESKQLEIEQLKKELDSKNEIIGELRKKVKILQQKTLREDSRKRKINDELAESNKSKSMKTCKDDVGQPGPGIPILNELSERMKQYSNAPVSVCIKDFAFQMHYYSPRAYEYTRNVIPSLPHPTCFNRWTKSIQTTPGFLPTAFEFLKQRNRDSPHKIFYALSLDEIHLRKQIVHTGDGFTGFLNNGDMAKPGNEVKDASAALFVVATEINGKSKIPLGYILTNGLKAGTLAEVIQNTILRIDEVGAVPISIVFDGLKVNIKAVEMLGANMDITSPNFRPFIPHPNGAYDIAVLLDVSHMLKLFRNLFKDYGTLTDEHGEEIRWSFIQSLHNLQEEKGLRLANSLTSRHVAFKQQKMKTGLAVQTLSNSVSIALGVCRELQIPGFQHTEATERCLSILDRLFDHLNCTSSGTGYKSPLKARDYGRISTFFAETKIYLMGLRRRMPNGDMVKICQTQRSTAITGLVITMRSVLTLMENYLKPTDSTLKYLPVYKIMQDPIETFFSTLRSRFGYNNNPNSFQLQHALKGILCMKTKSTSTGNCVEQLELTTKISPFSTLKPVFEENPTDEQEPKEEISLPEDINFCGVINNIVAYIIGFVGGKLCKTIKCSKCIIKLGAVHSEIPHIMDDTILIMNRDNGGLFLPSFSFIQVGKISEQVIRQKESKYGLAKLSKEAVCNAIVHECVDRGLSIRLDCEGNGYVVDGENHALSLIRDIALEYVKARFYYLARRSTLLANPTTNRNVCTKIVHFKGN